MPKSFPDRVRYDAIRAYERVKDEHAFNVPGYVKRKKVNQHSTIYNFNDGSCMRIRHKKGLADCWCEDLRVVPSVGLPLLINARGK